MSENDQLRARIEAAKQAGQPAENPNSANRTAGGAASALGHAMGMAVAVALGAFIGRAIDIWLGTSPWALLIFLVFGMCAGFLNIIRAANEMARKAQADAEAATSPKADE